MSSSQKKVIWEPQNGAIYLEKSGGRDRIILTRKGFIEAFFDEIERVEGKDALSMTFRLLLARLGAPKKLQDRPTLPVVDQFQDDFLLPYTTSDGNMPTVFDHVDTTRELCAYGNTFFVFQTVSFFQHFKAAMTEILTERGAHAILRRVAKQGGFSVGKKALDDYHWNELDPAMDSMDKVLSHVFPLYGWGLSRTVTGRGKKGRRMFFLKCWNIYESDGIKSDSASCVIHQSYLEGIGESLSMTYEDKTVESREIKCRAKGDEYCAFFIVQKEKEEKAVVWEGLEDDGKSLDAIEMTPEP